MGGLKQLRLESHMSKYYCQSFKIAAQSEPFRNQHKTHTQKIATTEKLTTTFFFFCCFFFNFNFTGSSKVCTFKFIGRETTTFKIKV